MLVLGAIFVHTLDSSLLQSTDGGVGLIETEVQVHDQIRKYLLKGFPLRKIDGGGINELGTVFAESKTLDIEFLHIIVEAIMLCRRDREKLIDLYEVETIEGWFV